MSEEDPFLTAGEARPVNHRPRVIEAEFASQCTECGMWIMPGDPIVSDGDGGWMEAQHA